MRKFIDNDFLLYNDEAKILYNNYASKCKIFDYHCHLNVKEIAENKRFKNITEIWLYNDHYKWRMMRANAIDESLITGDADDYDKFIAWVRTLQTLIGNPLYHWSHLELKRCFDVDYVINEKNADKIWNEVNKKLETIRVKDILNKFNVHTIGTTDDPIDSLEYHKLILEGKSDIGHINTKVIPSFRADKIINIENNDFADYVKKLEDASFIKIENITNLLKALYKRIDYFKSLGCVSADCSLYTIPFCLSDEKEINFILRKALNREELTYLEIEKYKTYLLISLMKKYKESNLVMQIHISAIRNTNDVMFRRLGADSGYDSIGDSNIIEKLSSLLKTCNNDYGLPKIIFYSLNSKDYYTLATLMGSFQEDDKKNIKGKMQLGAAWWFNDNKDGIEKQIKIFANTSALGLFIGMLTDSRSFLSYTRHEYFRRILCNIIGEWACNGEVPYDMECLGKIVENICFNNANIYFNN